MTDVNVAAAPPAPGARVLVVDDELQVRSALVRSLNLLGYRADGASSGHQALQMLEDAPCDVILTRSDLGAGRGRIAESHAAVAVNDQVAFDRDVLRSHPYEDGSTSASA